MVRAVSVGNSMVGAEMPGKRMPPQVSVGWTNTLHLRQFIAAMTGAKTGSPRSRPLIARHEPDSIELQLVERVFHLAQAAFGVGQRQCSEHAEAAGIFLHHLGAEFVADTGTRERIVLAVAEP
ncbi:MAG: hypothetical protein ACREFQ_17375, partial [Stellaceae bacterium]